MTIQEIQKILDYYKPSDRIGNQFEKRKTFKDFILKDEDCIVGRSVICFEKEVYVRWRMMYGTPTNLKNLTTCGHYEILEHKVGLPGSSPAGPTQSGVAGKIKIKNDAGKKQWYTINRFLYSLKIERKRKTQKNY